MLAEAINCSFLDADEYHSQLNKGIVLEIQRVESCTNNHSVNEVLLIHFNLGCFRYVTQKKCRMGLLY